MEKTGKSIQLKNDTLAEIDAYRLAIGAETHTEPSESACIVSLVERGLEAWRGDRPSEADRSATVDPSRLLG